MASSNALSVTILGSPGRSLALALVASWCLRTLAYLIRVRKLPPGPRKHVIMDNRGDMPYPMKEGTWRSFDYWHTKFGSVISFYLGRKLVISLGTIQAATDLFEKKGSIYSSRPRNIVAGEILCRNMRGLGMPYGQRWRNWRSLMHASMSVEASSQYKPLQDSESKLLLRDLLQHQNEPKSLPGFIRRYTVSVVTVVSYGRRIKSLDDHLAVAQHKIDEYYIRANVPGRYLVEIFPILTWLPKPLQWWRREPEEHFAHDSKLLLGLANEVKERMKKGIAYPSTATRALEKQGAFGLNDLETAYALSSPFGAGSGTTLSTIDFFLVAMLHYPQVMKKAQEELDSVVGRDRLPEYDDAASLPYLQALIKETMRWRPIAPIAVPHSVIADDTYEGKFIPAGTTVLANLFSMSQNEEMFPEPNKFRPERYLENPSLPHNFVFGFGRRICPGMHVAHNSLFILISRILWAFDVLPITPDAKLPNPDKTEGGIVIRPAELEYRLVARSKGADAIILAEAGKADVQLAAYD
ncbi:hypothetical protein H1R20_g9024, partial [Candolleomyces eurysporus]